MTCNKWKTSLLVIVFTVSVASIILTQSFAQEDAIQEQQRQDAVNQQMNLFSTQANLGEKKPMQGYDRTVSQTDPGIGHEQHQLAIIIPISEETYSGTLYYSASEPVQLVTLRGPLEPGEEKEKMSWTSDGETYYELTLINEFSSNGKWNFVGNALAVHTFKDSPFVLDYKVDYDVVDDSPVFPINSVNNVEIIAEFSFDKQNISIESFKVYRQIAGYNKNSSPIINLQGVVGIDKSILYRAADTHFNKGAGPHGLEHQFSEFTLTVYLQSGDMPIRKMTYRECDITNYTIDTLYDNDYSYNMASAFVLVDNFEITCAGMQPYHYDYQKYIDQYGLDAVMKMKNMEMSPKTYRDYGID